MEIGSRSAEPLEEGSDGGLSRAGYANDREAFSLAGLEERSLRTRTSGRLGQVKKTLFRVTSNSRVLVDRLMRRRKSRVAGQKWECVG